MKSKAVGRKRDGQAEREVQEPRSTPDPVELDVYRHRAIYLLNGPFSEFHKLVRKHHYAREQELDQAGAEPQPPKDPFQLEDTD